MIVFYLKNHRIIKQYQLFDYIALPKIISQDYRRYKITRPLDYLEKKMQKWNERTIIPRLPQFNYTLDKYFNPSSLNITIIIDEYSQNPNSMRNAIGIPSTHEIQLESFIISASPEPNNVSLLQNAIKSQYFLRFPSIPPVQYENFCKGIIPYTRYIHYQEQTEFKGYFIDMILLHPLTEYVDYEIEIRRKGWCPKGFSIQQIVYWEMFRIKFGIQNYSLFARIYQPIFKSALYPNHLLMKTNPNAKAMSYGLRSIDPEFIKKVFIKLVRESLKHKIIIPRIGSGDGLFIRSNCANNKNSLTNEYNDYTAGFRMHIGKRQGVGFTIIVLLCYCKDRWLPVYYKAFPGNTNENPTFRTTMTEFNEIFPNFFDVITYDSGASSTATNNLIRSFDTIPLIRAKKNYTDDSIFELQDGHYFLLSDIPDNWSLSLMDAVYSTRAMIEQFFSPITTVHHIKRMNTMKIENVDRLMGIYLTMVVIQALTSYKLNRPDLMMCSTAFTDIEWVNIHSNREID